jgi:hypothetical protein
MPCDFTGEFAEFSNVERKNHPTIIKVIKLNIHTIDFVGHVQIGKNNPMTSDLQTIMGI